MFVSVCLFHVCTHITHVVQVRGQLARVGSPSNMWVPVIELGLCGKYLYLLSHLNCPMAFAFQKACLLVIKLGVYTFPLLFWDVVCVWFLLVPQNQRILLSKSVRPMSYSGISDTFWFSEDLKVSGGTLCIYFVTVASFWEFMPQALHEKYCFLQKKKSN